MYTTALWRAAFNSIDDGHIKKDPKRFYKGGKKTIENLSAVLCTVETNAEFRISMTRYESIILVGGDQIKFFFERKKGRTFAASCCIYRKHLSSKRFGSTTYIDTRYVRSVDTRFVK